MNEEQRAVPAPKNEEQLTLGSSESGYQRLPFWLENTAGHNFAWLHLPYDGEAKSTGVIICNPLGYEYTHAHRSVRHIADQLAIHRYPSLRFDLYGMGDSPGDLFAGDLLERWVAEINAAIDTLKSHTGVRSICLLGIRMGATLAAKVAEHRTIEHMVLWSPVASGKRYVREMQALDRMSDRVREGQHDYFESAGFIMTATVAAEIKKIDIGKQACEVKGKILIVHRDDLVAETDLAAALRQQGITVDEITVAGYAGMMAEPQETEVPSVAIGEIINWLEQNPQQVPLNDAAVSPFCYKREARLLHQESTGLIEKICLFDQESKIFGILSLPLQLSTADLPLVVLLNSGSVHHVGPNRLYVELSRALAVAGFSCLRIDLANLGDSVVGTPANENHPYPDHSNVDVNTVLKHATTKLGFKRIVLAGLCSGAHTAFHEGLENSKVCESILINPLTFYWQEGMSLDIPLAHATIKDAKYYEGAIKNKDKWFKLLKGQVELNYILGFVAKHLQQKVAHKYHHFKTMIGLGAPSRLGIDLQKYSDAKRHISFFFSSNDPGYDILVAESPRTAKNNIKRGDIDVFFVEDADHTFSAKLKRDELIEKITHQLKARYL